MITSDAELRVVSDQIRTLETGLAAIRQEGERVHPDKRRLMSEPFIDDLTHMRALVDAYLGVEKVREASSTLMLSLEGDGIRYGDTRSSIVTRAVEASRKAVRTIISAIVDGDDQAQAGGRRPRWIEQISDLPLAGLATGSVRIYLGEPTDDELFDEQHVGVLKQSLGLLGTAVAAAGDDERLAATLQDQPTSIRNALLVAVRELAPNRDSEVDSVAVGGRWVAVPPNQKLTKATRSVVDRAARRLAPQEPQFEEVRGEIREVDLDKNEFTLRNATGDFQEYLCQYADDFADDVLVLFGSRAIVFGELISRSKRPVVKVLGLEPSNSETDPE